MNLFAAKLLEAIAAQGINVLSPRGRKRHEALRTVLGSYFRRIEKSFPMADTLRIAKRHEQPQEAASDLQGELQLLYREWIDGYSGELEAVLADSVDESVRDGFTGTLGEWVDRYKLPRPQSFTALVPKELLTWTQEYCAKLVTGINEETAQQLAGLIAQGMEEQAGIPGISRMIRDEFEDMSKYRADMIARTETARAFAEGNLKASEEVGCSEKEWIGFDACDVCTGNIAQGRISFDTDFSSGDDCPPSHPNCRCDVAYYGATRESVEDAVGPEELVTPEEQLSSGRIGNTSDLGGGVNTTKIIDIADTDLSGVWKPANGEAADIRKDFRVGEAYKNEKAAYDLSKEMGLNFVPDTVIREIDGQIGSLQAFVGNAENLVTAVEQRLLPSNMSIYAQTGIKNAAVGELQSTALFDVIIGNEDRHFGNILVQKLEGGQIKVWAIDHGFSCAQKLTYMRPGTISYMPMVGRWQVSAEFESGLQRLLSNEAAIRERLSQTLSKKSLDGIFKRAKWLSGQIQDHTLPGSQSFELELKQFLGKGVKVETF